jgi:hypothetical protein
MRRRSRSVVTGLGATLMTGCALFGSYDFSGFHTETDAAPAEGGASAEAGGLSSDAASAVDATSVDLAHLANCLDKDKFDNIGLGTLVTTPRASEKPTSCTGCNGASCNMCHSDGAGDFVMAIGNAVLPNDYTFNETKKTTPPYLQKYIDVGPTGPEASKAIEKFADMTAGGPAYSHPMYVVPAGVAAGIAAFVDDAVAKYDAGTCGL